MHPFPIIFPLLLLLNLHLHQAVEICSPFSCNHHKRVVIQFPFRVPGNQSRRCGFPGFELSCNPNSNSQAQLSLSPSKPFIVKAISYPDQLLLVSDPNHCLPKRVFNLNLTYSPFSFGPSELSYTFFNCSSSTDVIDPTQLPMGSSVISCMSAENYTVVTTFDERAEEKMVEKESEWKCEVIKRVNAAFWWRDMGYGLYPLDMSDVYLQLGWDDPNCIGCSIRGGSCGLVGDSGLQVGCFVSDSSGFPKSAKYGLILGAGIPGLLCIIGLTFFISSRVSARNRNRRYTNTESSPSIFPQPIILTLGLDRPTIESYPKTILGESKRLPKPSDSTCPICLSEYQPKETLRSIPDCNHYFHAECIDEWLRMNATCPLCRNSPEPSSALPDC